MRTTEEVSRVIHIINSLEHGGAEAMLCNLLPRLDRQRFEPIVISLIDDLRLAPLLRSADIPVHVVGIRPGIYDPRGLLRLIRMLRSLGPSLVQTWMDHSNLIGGIAARCGCDAPVLWSVHHSDHVQNVAKRGTLFTVWAGARLSKYVCDHIVLCARHSADMYSERGYATDRMSVIPNGFDTERFRPDPEARRRVRAELGITADAPLIGIAARFDPFKDHRTFVEAAREVARILPESRFLLCGSGIDASNAALMGVIAANDLGSRCHLLGPRSDMPAIYAALDLLVSSSISEAFPLVLGEAMACGTRCVTTDVGDSALIVGDWGRVVPSREPAALAKACVELLSESQGERDARSVAGRQRVCDLFDLQQITRRYEKLYQGLMSNRAMSSTLDSRLDATVA